MVYCWFINGITLAGSLKGPHAAYNRLPGKWEAWDQSQRPTDEEIAEALNATCSERGLEPVTVKHGREVYVGNDYIGFINLRRDRFYPQLAR